MNSSLKDLLVVETKPQGILLSVDGLPKCGKSSFGLSMPDPVFILDLNQGLTGVIEKEVKKGRKFYVQNVQIPLSKDLPGQAFTILSTEAASQWRKAIVVLQEALRDPDIKSVFIDTGGELWDLLRLARLGKLSQILPVQYTAVNAEFRQLLQVLLCCGKNVVLSHKVKPEYANDQKTGRFERAGFGDVGFDVQVELRADRDLKATGDDQFTLTFGDCRANKDLKGRVIRGADCNFVNVATLVYPETKPEDWM